MADEESHEVVDQGGGASETTDPAHGSSSGTDVSLKEFEDRDHLWMRRFLAERDLRHTTVANERDRRYAEVAVERDRRYAEVQAERDKAEVIARETQTYKDLKANELREQLAAERLEYASKTDLKAAIETITATLKPIVEYVAAQQGSRQGSLDQRQLLAWGIAAVLGAWALFQAFGG